MGRDIQRSLILSFTLVAAACSSAPEARTEPPLDGLIADLEDGDVSRRVNGLIAARYLGESARPALRPLVRLLFEPSPDAIEGGSYLILAHQALEALGAEPAIAQLIAELSGDFAEQAAARLLALARSDPRVRAQLIDALGVPELRAGAEAVLFAVGPAAYLEVARRAGVAADPQRRELAELLERFDAAPPEALPLVLGLLDDPSWRVQLAALRAVDAFEGCEAALPWLIEAARDPDHMLREEAIARAARLGYGQAEVLELLIGLLEVEHPWVRRQALRALESWGPMAWLAAPAILRAGERDPVIESEARQALRAVGVAGD